MKSSTAGKEISITLKGYLLLRFITRTQAMLLPRENRRNTANMPISKFAN
ncbi:hypothetical protein RCZ04_04920 [Capnocytophaga sp. HP1101]